MLQIIFVQIPAIQLEVFKRYSIKDDCCYILTR